MKPTSQKSPSTQKKKGRAHEAGGNPQEARKCYNQGKHHFFGRNGFEKSYELAFQQFAEAINNDPHMAGAYHYRGRCYLALGDCQRALYDFTMAIREDDKVADPKT